MERTIELSKLRPLNAFEIDVLKCALEDYAQRGGSKTFRDSAQDMLDQKMPENFLWASK